MVSVGSLFSGIGGLELGLEMALGEVDIRWQAECDPYARAVLEQHWPGVKRYQDVRDINGTTTEHVDIVCGGFPCQDISNAGKRAGITGERSGLWREFARIVRDLRPGVVFVENVAAIANRGLSTVLGDLAEFGYDAEWAVFLAAEAGAPHRRRRLFIFAYADREGLEVRCQSAARSQQQAAVGGRASQHAWSAESGVGRVADGVPSRVDRLRCLGNAVVPQQAALAFRELMARAMEGKR